MIAAGHADPWRYTPRQLAGFLYFARRRQRHELAEQLSTAALAARADGKEVKKALRDLTKDNPPGR